MRVPALHLRSQVRLRRNLRVQRACAELMNGAKRRLPRLSGAVLPGSGQSFLKGLPMRALFVTIGVLAPIFFAVSLLSPGATVDVDHFACLARCNGANVEVHRGYVSSLGDWRAALQIAASGEAVVVASYDRGAMGQTGSGHFSPVGGYHMARDLALILDVARFKYPPHWVSAEQLWLAMQVIDFATGLARGWLTIRRQSGTRSVDFSNCCAHGAPAELD